MDLPYEIKYGPFKIMVETPKGHNRYWRNSQTGEDGITRMFNDYGYIIDSLGHDGEAVDCFIGPNKHAEYIYVVKQKKLITGKYDESKCMIGFNSAEEAKEAYLKHYSDPDFFGGITPYHKDVFKIALKESKHNPAVIKAKLK